MGIDIEKLKGLAEEATQGQWHHGKNSDDVVAEYPAGHEQDPHEIDYYGGHLVAESISANNRDFIAAANPAAVLELIAELQGYQQGADVEAQAADDARAEARRLKTENEDGLAVIRTLKEQLDCYMKDAERYRILRDERFRPGRLSSNPEMAKYLDEYMICGDKMDSVIDSDMTQEKP